MKVTGIDHLNLQVSDLDRALRFYCEVLGMEKAFEELPDAVFLKAGNDLLTLAQTRGPVCTERFHFGFLVRSADEMARWEQWLAERGLRIEDRREEPAGGGIYFRDPDGYLLEIYYER
jgi:catechol 2,3-dioxygenase